MMNVLTRPFALAGSFLQSRFLAFRKEALILFYAVGHPQTPLHLRAGAVLAGLYLISPIDLIPFTIPFLGIVDDLIIVPWAVSQITRRLPQAVLESSSLKADRWIGRYLKRPLLALAIFIGALLLVWVAILALIWRLIFG